MTSLPVAIFTRNRTAVACAVVRSVLENLSCGDRGLRWILCDDGSEPGHVEALLDVFCEYDVDPSVHLATKDRHGLGASMNKGLDDAFSSSDECLRMEDDWILTRRLDIGEWVSIMGPGGVGCVRFGSMFRKRHECLPFGHGLVRIESDRSRVFTVNNQIALVHRSLYDLGGGRAFRYPENVRPYLVEHSIANMYNPRTDWGRRKPWTCWPEGWARNTLANPSIAFLHIGASSLGHKQYIVPSGYRELNNPELDARLRREALECREDPETSDDGIPTISC